jgi:serine/threonine-protein kinase SRPK3
MKDKQCAQYPPIRIKIADLGNATPVHRHYTNDIQTRQYRCPEVILGKDDWDTGADIWSAACLIFEMFTSDYLFAPTNGQTFNKDDDHIAQIIELMGEMPHHVKFGGKYSREIFRSSGRLRHIQQLRYWGLKNVMKDKYDFGDSDAVAFAEFMEPMLALDPRRRATAAEMCNHPWLELGSP